MDDALSLIVKEGNRAGEVVGRIRALIKKAPARKDAVAINDAILEVIALTRTEAANNSVSVRTQLAEGLPRVQGDRVQLQQVLLNLIINAIEAMRDVGEEERELLISTRNEPDGVSVEVRDSGPGFAPESSRARVRGFYTTKPERHGHGPVDLPVDHRSPWRTAVGDPVRTAGCSLSVYDPCHLSGRIVIESMSLFGT